MQHSRPDNGHPVITFSHCCTQRGQPLDHCSNPVRLLYPQFRCIFDFGTALCKARCHNQNRDLVYQRGDFFPFYGSGMQVSSIDKDITHRFSCQLADILSNNICTHSLEYMHEACPGGIDAYVFYQDL